MARAFYSLDQVFAPTRVGYDWPGPAYPGHGHRRITPAGLKQRLKRYLAERPEGFPEEAHAWSYGLKDLVDHELPDRLAVLWAFDAPAVMWATSFTAGQDWAKPKSPSGPLLHHLLSLPAIQRRARGARPLDRSDSAEVAQRIAHAVGMGMAHTPDPLPGTPEAWAEVFGHWLAADSPLHRDWVAAVMRRRPELVYARAVDVAGSPEWGPLALAPFPVLLTQGVGSDAERWAHWLSWGADPYALAGPATVPLRAPLPRAFASLAPEGDTVGFTLACSGIVAAQQWLSQTSPRLAQHLPAMAPHQAMETVRVNTVGPQVAPVMALAEAPIAVLQAVPSLVWTAVRTVPGLLLKDYAVATSTSRLADLTGWDPATLVHHLSHARGLAGEDVWDAVMEAAAGASVADAFTQADRAGQVLHEFCMSLACPPPMGTAFGARARTT